MKNISHSECRGFHVVFQYNTLGISILDGYLAKNKKEIREILEVIHSKSDYTKLVELGYNRTIESEYQEWCAHNFLYKLGVLRERTKTVDLSNNESKFRRFGYAILSIF